MTRVTRLTMLALALLGVLLVAGAAQAGSAIALPAAGGATGGRLGTVLIHFETPSSGPAPAPAFVALAKPAHPGTPIGSALVAPTAPSPASADFARRYEIDAFGMFIAVDARVPLAAPTEPLEGARATALAEASHANALPAPAAPGPGGDASRSTSGGRVVRTAEPSPLSAAPGSELPPVPAAPLAAGAGAIAIVGFALRLYHRVTSGPDREKGLRSSILARLADGGPARERDLAAALSVDRTTARYHARLLVKSGLVVERRLGKIPWFGLTGDPRLRDLNAAAVALQHPLAKALFEAARAHERAKLGELAAVAATSPQNANYHLGRLVAAGALVSEKAPDGARYRIAAGPPRDAGGA